MLQSLSRASKSALLALAPGVCDIGDERCCCGLQRRVIARRLYELLRTPMIFARVASEASLSASGNLLAEANIVKHGNICSSRVPGIKTTTASRESSMCDAIVAEVVLSPTTSSYCPIQLNFPRARLENPPRLIRSRASTIALAMFIRLSNSRRANVSCRGALGPWVCLKQRSPISTKIK